MELLLICINWGVASTKAGDALSGTERHLGLTLACARFKVTLSTGNALNLE